LLEKAKIINKNNSYIYVYLDTLCYYFKENFDEVKCKKLLDNALELNDKNGTIYNNFGHLNIKKGLSGDALFKKVRKYGSIISLYSAAMYITDKMERVKLLIEFYNYTCDLDSLKDIRSLIKKNSLILVPLIGDYFMDTVEESEKVLWPCIIEV
jgi:hypothetical protein